MMIAKKIIKINIAKRAVCLATILFCLVGLFFFVNIAEVSAETATYYSTWGAPRCTTTNSPCDAPTSLLQCAGTQASPGPEANQPNTLDSCAETTNDTCHIDESVESITVKEATAGDGIIKASESITVDFSIFCYDPPETDRYAVYYSNSATTPSWVRKTTGNPICSTAGNNNLSETFTIDSNTGYHAVRVINEYNQDIATACDSDVVYTDWDDLAFNVAAVTTPATWREAEDTADPTAGSALAKNTSVRLRLSVANAGTATTNYAYRLEYASTATNCSSDPGSWAAVPVTATTQHFEMVASTHFVDGNATTARFTNSESHTFVAGKMVEDPSNTSASISLASSTYTEIEYALQATSSATNSGTYCFRVTNSGTALDSYSRYAQLTLASGAANTLPVASSVSIDSAAASITLTENTTKTVSCVGTVTDANGYADITSVSADFYRTSVGIGGGTDNNNYYQLVGDTECVPTGGSGNTETYTCDFDVQYYADPTDSGSPNSTDDWTCNMIPSDSDGTGTSSSDTIEMNSLLAISVTSPINYGTLDPDTDTGTLSQSITVTNTGNRSLDIQLAGDDLVSAGNTIPVGNQEYSDTVSISYGSGTDLTGTASTLVLILAQPTAATIPVTDLVYWGMGVPPGMPVGTYAGINYVTAIGD